MPRFTPVEESEATSEVARLYQEFKQKMGFPCVPNFLSTQGASSSMVAGTWGLVEHVLLEGHLPRATKELIFLAVAADRECKYCQEAHAACCRMLGVEEQTIQAVREGLKGDIPQQTREILLFSIKCASAPEELTDDDFAILAEHGLDKEQTLEVIATSAMAVYATIIADATLLDVDAMFAEIS